MYDTIHEMLDKWFIDMIKKGKTKILIREIKHRIKKCEEVLPDQRGQTIVDCLNWCKQKQYELSRLL